MSELKVNKVTPRSGTTVTLGDSGDTIVIGAGASFSGGALTGSITLYGSTSIPTGYLECEGSAVSRSTYADLFAVIGTTFGVGDGSTTFNVPDLRDNFPVGVSGTKALATKAGSNTATLTTTNLASHSHDTNISPAFSSGSGVGYAAPNGAGSRITSANTGSGTAFNTFPPYIALTFIIKT